MPIKQAKFFAGGIESDSLDIVLDHLRRDLPSYIVITDRMAQVEAIRQHALAQILALGFDKEEVQVDIGISPADSDSLYKLAQALGWQPTHNWYESPEATECGNVTLYFEPSEQVW